jgi:hypothetical protein
MHMMSKTFSYISFAAVTMAGGALCAWLFAVPPARALVDTAQILIGSNGIGGGTIFMSPSGTSASVTESRVQVPFPAGTLSSLRVRLVTENVPTGGSLSAMVRVNGIDTTLTCSLVASGICTSGNKQKAVNNNGLVSLRVDSDLADAGITTMLFSLQFD